MTRHSLLIGVEAYDGTGGLNPLTCPIEDVAALKTVVSDSRYMGAKARVEVLNDPDNATAMRSLSRFLRDVQPDDTVIFFFSGHGMRDMNRDLFLCFTDSDPYDLELTALNVRRLGAIFETKSLQRVLVVLDCCYSGAAGAALTKDSVLSQINDVERALPDGRGVFVLSSAGEAETSKEGETHSVFTHHLVEGITSGAADIDATGSITVQNIAQYLRQKVPEDAPGQTPHLSSKAVTGSFTIAHNDILRKQRVRAEADKTRNLVFDAARDRILASVQSRDASRDLMNSVMDWMDANPDAAIGDPAFDLLSDYSTRDIGIVDFSKAWDKVDITIAQPQRMAAFSPSVPGDQFDALREKVEALNARLATTHSKSMPLSDALIRAVPIAIFPVFVCMLAYHAIPAEDFAMPRWSSAWGIFFAVFALHYIACFITGWITNWPKAPILWATGFLVFSFATIVNDPALFEGELDHGIDLAGAAMVMPWVGYLTYLMGRKLRGWLS